jgi:hypothetical protein
VVEHVIGNDGVDCSIQSGGTIPSKTLAALAASRPRTVGKKLRVGRNSSREKYRVRRRPVAHLPRAAPRFPLGRFPAIYLYRKTT